jgi:TolA-binding protein
MLGMIRVLPIILVLAGGGYAAHLFIVNQLEGRLQEVQRNYDVVNQQNVALQAAAEQNARTLENIQAQMQAQAQQIGTLTTRSAELEREKNEYLSIFREHNLYRLARARPGMIEPRINNGTNDVFRQIEQDSREIANADDENEES